MKVIPTGTARPNIGDSNNGGKAQATREKAIQAYKGAAQPEQQVVQNQSQVQAEEMTAIIPSTKSEPKQESVEQIDTSINNEQADEVKAAEVPAEDKRLSERFARLARQEKQARLERQRRETEFKRREEELKKREEAVSAQPKFDPSQYISKDLLKRNTLQALAEAEVSYDELVQQQLGLPQQDPRMAAQVSKLEAKIQQLTDALEAQQKGQQEQQQAGYQAAVKQIRSDVTSLVRSEPAEYELIGKTGSVGDVVELIEKTYAEEGRILSVEEAAQEVENYLLDESLKLSQSKKIQAKLNARQAEKAKQQAPKTAEQQKQPMKTLTNATSSSRQLTAKERAMLAFRGELKS